MLAIAGLPTNATVQAINPVPGYTLQAQVRLASPKSDAGVSEQFVGK